MQKYMFICKFEENTSEEKVGRKAVKNIWSVISEPLYFGKMGSIFENPLVNFFYFNEYTFIIYNSY